MPSDLIVARMEGGPSDIEKLTVTYKFSNGQVMQSTGGIVGVYWGKSNVKDPRQRFTFNRHFMMFHGDIVNFYSEFWMNCETNLLVGSISLSQPVPVSVYLSSYGGKGNVALKPGQKLLDFELPVASYGTSNAPSQRAQELLA